MVTIPDRRQRGQSDTHLSIDTGAAYSGYREIDTSVPPKARPAFRDISVNGVVVAEAAILAEVQNHPAGNPGQALAAAARALVVRELLLQKARARGFRPKASRRGKGPQETAEDAAIRALVEAEIKVPQATREECERHYRTHLHRFRSEPLWEARHILVARPAGPSADAEAARDLAWRIADQLAREPGRFDELARRHSACPSAQAGGNLGQIGPGSTVPAFEAALSSMVAGTITRQPVETAYGFHVIALDRMVAPAQLPFEAVAETIAAWLEAQSYARAVAQYVAILAGEAEIAGIDIRSADGPLVN